MNVFIILLSMVAAVACGVPAGCNDCHTKPNTCVHDPKQCVTLPCYQYHCIKNKPGTCPKMAVQGKDCKHDQECPKTEKCCWGNCIKPIVLNRCGGSNFGVCHFGQACLSMKVNCVKAPCKPQYKCFKNKPGTCPKMTVQGKVCKHDQECPKSKKCCWGNCIKPIVLNRCGGSNFGVCHFGQACLSMKVNCVKAPCKPQYKCFTIFQKPGKCPVKIAQHFKECIYDDQCLRKQKCCNGKCVQPKITVRPGRCPRYPLICPHTGNTQGDCVVDTDCKAPMKCCVHCGKKCTMPMPKHGACPVSKRPCILNTKRIDQCTNDYECKGQYKCCKDECGILVCVKK